MNFDEMPNPKVEVISTFIEYLKNTNANFDADKFREFIYARQSQTIYAINLWIACELW